MNNELIQVLGQQQKLIMTNDMQLLLKFLQMPITELQEHISNELQENPVLETDNIVGSSNDDNINSESTYTAEDKNLMMYKEIMKQSQYSNVNYEKESNYNESSEDISPFNYILEKKSLKDYLKMQLIECNEKASILDICDYIIESLDHKGYLESDIKELSDEIGVESEQLEYCLNIIQNFQPSGIGARSLNECLKIQVKR